LRTSEVIWHIDDGIVVRPRLSYKGDCVQVLLRIIEQAVWANTHLLPKELPVYEIRTREGYGAR
jgi:hypothetical protein